MSEHSQLVEIVNERGLHARAATKFVELAAQFDADIFVRHGEIEVSGKSIMGILMLVAAKGSTIEVIASGPQGTESVEALCALVTSRFGEDE